jgi:phosphate-selective porin OprO/OprP
MELSRWALVVALVSAQANGPVVRGDEPDELIRRLTQRVDELEQQVKILQRTRELDVEASDARAKESPRITAGATGFSFSSADTNFVLKIRGGLQVDGRFYSGNSTAQDTFLLRRVRPIVEGTVYEKFDYRLMFDFASGVSASAGNNGAILDAYGGLRLFPELNLRVGKFKEPVGLERLQSWNNLLFVERGFPTQLAPNRDTGVMLHGEVFAGRLNYQLGVFNGSADGGSSDFDTADSDKDVAARLFAHPFKESGLGALRGLGLGVSGTIGEQERAPRGYSTPGAQSMFGYRTDSDPSKASVVGDGTQWRVSPQGYWYWGPFGLLGEHAISSTQAQQAGGGAGSGRKETFRNTAWQVEASWFVTGEENSFKPVTPLRPFSMNGGGWGALQVAARVGELDPDDAAFPVFADPASSAAKAFAWGLGFNWYLNRFIKFSVNYEHTDLRGRDGTYKGLEREQVILTRFQAAF